MFSGIKEILTKTFRQYSMDRVPLLAAALSYYTLFSLAPLFLISVSVAGAILGEEAARERFFEQISRSTSPRAAEAVRSIVEGASQADAGALPAVMGVALLLIGASAVFGQLKAAMNAIWNVEPHADSDGGGFAKAVWTFVKRKLFAFSLVFVAGALLVASLLVTSASNMVFEYLESITPVQIAAVQVGDFVLSLLLVASVFALLFKYVPDAKTAWRDVWIGAAITSVLFNLGKLAISYYLGQSAVASTFGAAGSIVVILLWVYFACQIVFFGAELTQVISDRTGRREVEKEIEGPKL